MKIIIGKFIGSLILLTLFTGLAVAHEGENHNHADHDHKHEEHKHGGDDHSGHSHGVAISKDASLYDLLQAIYEEHHQLSKSIRDGDLGKIHDGTESISSLAKLLPKKIKAEEKPRVQGLANNLIRAADELHESGDSNDQIRSEANLKKLDALIKLLFARLEFSPTEVHNRKDHHAHPHGEKCSSPDITIDIVSRQFSFEPSVIKVKQGQRVCLRLTSEDIEHGIMIDTYHAHVHGSIHSTGEVQFVADKPGEFNFICHQECGIGHADMKGKFIVE